MKLSRSSEAAVILALTLGTGWPAQAETPVEKGLAIAEEADRRGDGYGDSSTTMQMVLRNRQGEESSREIRSKSLEVKGDGDKSLIVFDEPRDVAGTALLGVWMGRASRQLLARRRKKESP